MSPNLRTTFIGSCIGGLLGMFIGLRWFGHGPNWGGWIAFQLLAFALAIVITAAVARSVKRYVERRP